jgi:hypothetical protein
MEAFSDIFTFMAGVPAMAGLFLTGLAIFLTSDWRLSLTALLAQYVLVGLALTRSIQAEVAIVKILAGVLAVFILYLTARRVQELGEPQHVETASSRFLGLQLGWAAGPLGLPLRFLTTLLIALALVRLFNDVPFSQDAWPALFAVDGTGLSPNIIFIASWLGATGMVGLILSGDPLRVAPALLTILTGFDLAYASLEPSLAIVGFLGALTLLTAMSFSYLATCQVLTASPPEPDQQQEEAGP